MMITLNKYVHHKFMYNCIAVQLLQFVALNTILWMMPISELSFNHFPLICSLLVTASWGLLHYPSYSYLLHLPSPFQRYWYSNLVYFLFLHPVSFLLTQCIIIIYFSISVGFICKLWITAVKLLILFQLILALVCQFKYL